MIDSQVQFIKPIHGRRIAKIASAMTMATTTKSRMGMRDLGYLWQYRILPKCLRRRRINAMDLKID